MVCLLVWYACDCLLVATWQTWHASSQRLTIRLTVNGLTVPGTGTGQGYGYRLRRLPGCGLTVRLINTVQSVIVAVTVNS